MSPYRVRSEPCGHAARPALGLPLLLVSGVLALPQESDGQAQSLAFTGGVLLNAQVNFRNVGTRPFPAVGPESGGAVQRRYDDGFNGVDDTGNLDNTTTYWGYDRASQLQGEHLVLTAISGSAGGSLEDRADFIAPSANLEYRGSLGSLDSQGAFDWGLVLGIGYQFVGADASETVVTDAMILEDRFTLNGNTAESLPSAPYAGSPAAGGEGAGPRIGSVPTRTVTSAPGSRLMNGRWELSTDLYPVTGGLYVEAQLAGRLNAIVSAGIMAILVNAEVSYWESSTVANLPVLIDQASENTDDVLMGGFVQLGLDWALWEKASLVASARWQPVEKFNHGVNGREAEIDFSGAFAVHAGVSFRF